MATDVSALSSYVNVTREAFRKNVEFAGNKSFWLWNNFKPSIQKHAGETLIYCPLQTQLPESATFSAEGAADPTAVQPAFAKPYIYMKKLLTIMKYNEEIIQLNKGDEAIIRDIVNLRMGTKTSYDLLREFSIHTPGSGILCTATGAAAGQVVTMNSVRWLRVGMVLDGYDASNNHDADSVVITNVNPSTKAVTFSGTVSSVDANTNWYYNDTWTTSGSRTYAACKLAHNGIETICSDVDPAYGDFMGIDRGTYDYMKATVKYGSTPGTPEAFTLDRLSDLLDLLNVSVGSSELPTFGYCNLGTYKAIYNAYRSEHQPTVFMPAKDGIPEGLTYAYGATNLKIVASRFAAPNTLYLPNIKHTIKYVGPEGWEDLAGQVQKISGYQQFYETYRGWQNLGTDLPQSNAALFDITEA